MPDVAVHVIFGEVKYLCCLLILITPLFAYSQRVEFSPFVGAGYAIAMDNYSRNYHHDETNDETGLNMLFELHHHWVLISGLEWMKVDYSVGPLMVNNSPEDYEFTFRYLRVPCKAEYEYDFTKKLCASASGGLMLNYLLDASRKGGGSGSSTYLYTKFNVGLGVDIAATYRFTDHFGVTILPFYTYFASKAPYRDAKVSFQTYGVRLGVLFNLD